MADHILDITDGFWNVRGSFKIAGLLDVGTQCSLVRLRDGRFVLLDSYTLTGDVLARVQQITGGQLFAIVNLHPFHTIHVTAVHKTFPEARLYGCQRHVDKAPDLPWQPERVESPEFAALWPEGEFRFSVSAGVDLVTADPNVHAGSVLAFHLPTRTLHVDDTLTWSTLPLIGGLGFHPATKKALGQRPGAVAEFRAWAQELIGWCERDVDFLLTAHMKTLSDLKGGQQIAGAVRQALGKLEGTLAKHEAKWG